MGAEQASDGSSESVAERRELFVSVGVGAQEM